MPFTLLNLTFISVIDTSQKIGSPFENCQYIEINGYF